MHSKLACPTSRLATGEKQKSYTKEKTGMMVEEKPLHEIVLKATTWCESTFRVPDSVGDEPFLPVNTLVAETTSAAETRDKPFTSDPR